MRGLAPARVSDIFAALADRVAARWARVNHDDALFPDIAWAALRSARLHRATSGMDVVQWLGATHRLPDQHGNEPQMFGQPSITVEHRERFMIEVLFWVDATTAIHHHTFSGAFAVLDGSSIHTRFAFTPRVRVNPHLSFGEVRFQSAELLVRGDVRRIQAGPAFVHSVFHLDRPSVSVVLRTHRDPDAGPHVSYRPPSVAIDPRFESPHLEKKLQGEALLHRIDRQRHQAFVRLLLSKADLHQAVLILFTVQAHLPWRVFGPLVRGVARRHALDGAEFLRNFETARRLARIAARREQVHSPDHRFLLALLMTVPTRTQILALVRKRVPGRAPVRTVLQWVRQMATQRQPGSAEANILGLPMDETALEIFGYLLEGKSGAGVRRALTRTFGANEVQRQRRAITQLSQALRTSDLFKPLFRAL